MRAGEKGREINNNNNNPGGENTPTRRVPRVAGGGGAQGRRLSLRGAPISQSGATTNPPRRIGVLGVYDP